MTSAVCELLALELHQSHVDSRTVGWLRQQHGICTIVPLDLGLVSTTLQHPCRPLVISNMTA